MEGIPSASITAHQSFLSKKFPERAAVCIADSSKELGVDMWMLGVGKTPRAGILGSGGGRWKIEVDFAVLTGSKIIFEEMDEPARSHWER